MVREEHLASLSPTGGWCKFYLAIPSSPQLYLQRKKFTKKAFGQTRFHQLLQKFYLATFLESACFHKIDESFGYNYNSMMQ